MRWGCVPEEKGDVRQMGGGGGIGFVLTTNRLCG